MTLTLAYAEATVDAVTLAITGLPAPAAGTPLTCIAQRSVDGGIRYVTVRGMVEAAITAGAVNGRDYEFVPGPQHTYRAGLTQQVADLYGRTVAAGGWGT